MTRILLRRAALAVVTLWLLSLIIFLAGQVLPGDPGRNVLGPFASASAVRTYDHQLGVDRPLVVQYLGWVGGMLHGNMGISYTYRTPVRPIIIGALGNSAKLALLALLIIIPLGIAGGVFAALHRGRLIDRAISLTGLSASTVPEFVSGIVVITVFAVALKVLPYPTGVISGTSPLNQLDHLIMPVVPLVLVLFGYVARMARAGTIEALDSDYTRTATLKGLPRSVVIRRHILRNALLPTITVIATQTGYLIGGLVVVERLFDYPGIGDQIYSAASGKDFPMLEAGVLIVGVVYLVATLIADVLYTALNPRLRVEAIT